MRLHTGRGRNKKAGEEQRTMIAKHVISSRRLLRQCPESSIFRRWTCTARDVDSWNLCRLNSSFHLPRRRYPRKLLLRWSLFALVVLLTAAVAWLPVFASTLSLSNPDGVSQSLVSEVAFPQKDAPA